MNKLKASALIALSLIGLALPASAQQSVTYGKVEQPWYQQGKISGGAAVTSASSRTALPTIGLLAWVCNTGANDAYVAFGDVTVTATATGSSWLKSGACATYDLFPFFNASRANYIAAITASSTTTLTVETGIGSGPSQAGASSASTPVTQGTVPWIVGGSATGSAVPSTAFYNGLNVAGTLRGQSGLSTGSLFPSAVAIVDASGNQITTFGSSVSGYEFQKAPTITVQNAAYSAGNSLGGLVTVTGAARTNGGQGILNGVRLKSTGGSTNTVWIYAWSKTPAATCTDKSAYVPSTSDNPYALVGFPTSVVLGNSPGAWDTATYAQLSSLIANFTNQDTSPGTAIYMCFVTAGAVTPASTADLTMVASGMQNRRRRRPADQRVRYIIRRRSRGEKRIAA
jgi:hypothetical protein